MPAALEARLRRQARRKFPHDRKRQDRYTYGTLRKTGWKPRRNGGQKGNARGEHAD